MARNFKLSLFVIIHLSYYIDKPMPRVFITIAGPLYLGSRQPDYDTELQLVGARLRRSTDGGSVDTPSTRSHLDFAIL